MTARRWLLLIHQLPPRPLYLRARIRQRLARAGAVALKNSVYVLPAGDERRAALEGIADEAVAGGGEAFLCAAEFFGRPSDAEVTERFQAERAADYRALAAELGELARQARRPARPRPDELAARLKRARRRWAEIAAIDFFNAPGGGEVDPLVAGLESRLASGPAASASRDGEWTGRTWVTRRGVHVDRIASAWLIRRFVDPAARFRFIAGGEVETAGKAGSLTFDMPGGDFTHEGDRCTFETLLARFRPRDRGLAEIAEIVHAIDLKDDKFARPDAAGVERLLVGILLSHPDDRDRLDRGFALFDDLYESFRKRGRQRLPRSLQGDNP